VTWGSFVLGYLCGLVTLPGFILLCLMTATGRAKVGYGEDQ
jgi:hypothetical protein